MIVPRPAPGTNRDSPNSCKHKHKKQQLKERPEINKTAQVVSAQYLLNYKQINKRSINITTE